MTCRITILEMSRGIDTTRALVSEKGYKKGSIQKSIGGKETLETELVCVSLISSFLSIPSSHH